MPSKMIDIILQLLMLLLLPWRATAMGPLRFTNTDWRVIPGEYLHLSWENMQTAVNIYLCYGTVEDDILQVNVVADRLKALEMDWEVAYHMDPADLLPNKTTNASYFLQMYDWRGSLTYSPALQLKIEEGATATNAPDTTTPTAVPPEQAGSPISGPFELSTAAKAGIGAGAGAGSIAVLALVSWFFYSRGRKVEATRNGWTKHSASSTTDDGNLESGRGSAMDDKSPPTTPRELDANEKPAIPKELDVVETPVELGAAPDVWELPTGEKCMQEMEEEEERDQGPGQGNEKCP